MRWSDRPDSAAANRYLVLIAYLCGLGYANHMAGMLPAPAVALAVVMRRPATLLRGRLLLACLVALFVGITPFATQPIRAAHFPAMNEGEPTACRTKLELSCTMSKGTYDAFMYNFNRGQYGKPSLSERQASFTEQAGMWWLYFKWQWLRDPDAQYPFTQALLAASFFVLGLLGGWAHYQRDRKSFWYFSALMFTMTLMLIYYLNFKLGASQDQASQAPHEVRDRDYFYLWSYSAWGVWAALGLVYIWESAAALVGTQERREGRDVVLEPSRRGWLATSPALLLAIVPLAGNWTSASRAHHHATRDVAADLLNSVEPYGVLVTVGDNDTFPLWYAQEVEGIRRDVVVAVTSLLNTDWYARQIIRRPIYDYDEAKGPAIYRGRKWVKPTTPPLHMTFAQADAIPDYYPLPEPMQFTAPGITATVDPRNLEYGVLMRADAFVLRMIKDSWPERPIYFARSGVGYPRSLGLENNVLTQGSGIQGLHTADGCVASAGHASRAGRRMARRRANDGALERRVRRASLRGARGPVDRSAVGEHAGAVRLRRRGIGGRAPHRGEDGRGERCVRDDAAGGARDGLRCAAPRRRARLQQAATGRLGGRLAARESDGSAEGTEHGADGEKTEVVIGERSS